MTISPQYPDRRHQISKSLNSNDRREFEDQATRLRELARPNRTASQSVSVSSNEQTPYVVLLSELPANQGVIPLTLHLADQLQTSQSRTLVTDLAPSASKLAMLADSPARLLKHIGFEEIQQLWNETPNGKSLACGRLPEKPSVMLAAQPSGDHPSADQMPRICEQLLRFLRQNPANRNLHEPSRSLHRVFLTSESLGVPLDQACWQAADEIVLLCPYPVDVEHVGSILTARLPTVPHRQRIVLLTKRGFKIRDWTLRKKVERSDAIRVHIGDTRRDVEHIIVPGFQTSTRLDGGLAHTAKALIRELAWTPAGIELRKAS